MSSIEWANTFETSEADYKGYLILSYYYSQAFYIIMFSYRQWQHIEKAVCASQLQFYCQLETYQKRFIFKILNSLCKWYSIGSIGKNFYFRHFFWNMDKVYPQSPLSLGFCFKTFNGARFFYCFWMKYKCDPGFS